MLTLLLIFLVCALLFGGFGYSRGFGYVGWGPLGFILILLLILYLAGGLHV